LSSNSNESENNKLEYSLKDKERIKIMADFEELSFSYLGLLSNAHHDGTTQQIDDCCGNFETENQVFLRKAQTLHQCRVKEDEAWKKSQVDPVVKQLQAADKRQDRSRSALPLGSSKNFVRFARRRTTVVFPQHRERLRFPAR